MLGRGKKGIRGTGYGNRVVFLIIFSHIFLRLYF